MVLKSLWHVFVSYITCMSKKVWNFIAIVFVYNSSSIPRPASPIQSLLHVWQGLYHNKPNHFRGKIRLFTLLETLQTAFCSGISQLFCSYFFKRFFIFAINLVTLFAFFEFLYHEDLLTSVYPCFWFPVL